MNTTATAPRKLPRQSRSQATVTAILDATAQVLVERGYAATSTNAVAERAGVSVGSLYQYFPNKDALITALHERHGRKMLGVIESAMARHAGSTLEDALAGVIGSVVEAHRVEAELHRVLETQFAGLDPDDHDEMEARMAELMRELLAAHRERIVVEDLRLATFMLMHAVHAQVHAIVMRRPAGMSLKAATREMVRMALTYLTTVPRLR